MTLFYSRSSLSKPNKSTVLLQPKERKILSCQKIYNCNHGQKLIAIPDNFVAQNNREPNEHADFILEHIWLDLGVTFKDLKMTTCAGSCSPFKHEITSSASRVFAVFTHQVRKDEIFNTSVRNLISISEQLEQKYLPVL